VFGVPELHEDDALRALRAAVEMRDALAAMPERSALRVGVDSGEVFAHETAAADLPATGAPVTGARRLEQIAAAGEIVFGPATLRLVRGAVEAVPVKLRSRRTQQPPAFRLVALVPGAPAIERRPDAPLVDRERELGALLDAFESVRDRRLGRVVTVVGDGGVGKTRLGGEPGGRVGCG